MKENTVQHNQIAAAIFDMDGLLIDSEPLWWEAEMEVFRQVSINLTQAQCLETTGLRVDQIVEYWYQRYPWQGMTKQQLAEQLVQKVAELITAKGEPKAGIYHAFNFFQQKNVRLALASSSPYVLIDAVLKKLGIGDVLQVVHSAQEEVYGKPHPGVYLTTAQKMDVSPWHCVALEDSLNGMLAAKSARMKCIAIPENFPDYDPKLIIADAILGSLSDIQDDIWLMLNGHVATV